MEPKVEKITPSKAETILDANAINRSLRPGVVEKYADDMRHGRWTQCTVPISFYDDGELADGQHRLYAIIEAGIPQNFIVLRGLSRDDGLNIDTGLTRSLVDAGRISGADPNLSNTLIAVARGMTEGNQSSQRNKGLSNAARLEMVAAHRDAAEWAVKHGPTGKGIRNAALLAAVGRAYYAEGDKERLARFCEVVSTGFANGEAESAAVALRNYFIGRKGLVNSGVWRDTFLKSMNAVSYFMRGRKLTVIKSVADEAYPLPKKRAPRRVSA